MVDFDDQGHEEENPETVSVGDRRQEIVFIGSGIEGAGHKERLIDSLDRCLLDDEEYQDFRAKRDDEELLQTTFKNPIEARMVSF